MQFGPRSLPAHPSGQWANSQWVPGSKTSPVQYTTARPINTAILNPSLHPPPNPTRPSNRSGQSPPSASPPLAPYKPHPSPPPPHRRALVTGGGREARRSTRRGGGGGSHEGAHGAARQAVRPGHHPRLQAVEVEPVREHVAGADRGGEHQGGGGVVLREAHGVRVQGQDQEQRHPLPLHLGEGHPPPRQLRRRPRQVQVQPPAGLHGAQGQGVHVPEQHLRSGK